MDNHKDTCTIEERRQTKHNQEWTITRTHAPLRNEDKQTQPRMDNHKDTCTIEERRQTKHNKEWTITRTHASLRNEDKQNTTKNGQSQGHMHH
jgi:precorrin isomerase